MAFSQQPRGHRHTRRDFIATAAAASALAAGAQTQERKATIFVLADASDATVTRPAVRWAIEQLRNTLETRGLAATVQNNLDQIHTAGERIVIAPGGSEAARQMAGPASLPGRAESFALLRGAMRGQPGLLITGPDVRGLVYGILEVADRVQLAGEPLEALRAIDRVVEQPFNEIRSIARLFVSDIEDKPWFYDKNFWTEYLTMLATQRFNRFSLTLGLGYDLPRLVLDAYFIFAYPFLLRSVPGYEVSVSPALPEGEIERNLSMLQWISSEASNRGLHFQLGLWSHTYEWIDSPNANYVVKGLTAVNHAPYCRDALRLLLQSCPAIDGITFRAHSESGIKDGSYDFWKAVFQGVAECGRRVEIDLHSKGIDFRQIQMALDTKQPVRVSAKYTAEHMGLPGHQAAIRELERSHPSSTPQDRSATRYGYADYLREDRPYGVYFRMWPGKDKIVLWGDPALVAGYSRHSGFCGVLGLELCEPMSFKGRQGSGLSPERRIYADKSLIPEGGEWKKYLYNYRLWGRHLYDPDAKPESYRRYLSREFGAAAPAVETSLANASRVIPLITSAHLPSASAMTYWPEMYTNQPVADQTVRSPYGDTPSPKLFGYTSPLDPGIFSPINEFVAEKLSGSSSGRYSPADVARWLDSFAGTAEEQMRQARVKAGNAIAAEFRRVEIDALLQAGLGHFFAEKLRAGIAYMVYEKNGDQGALRDAIHYYRAARDAWVGIVKWTKGVYVDDLTFGNPAYRRGHWADRLVAIERDIASMERLLKSKADAGERSKTVTALLEARPPGPRCAHASPQAFKPGQPLEIELAVEQGMSQRVRIHYRHVNQAEPYRIEDMAAKGRSWRFRIPASYTESAFPVMYYFALQDGEGNAWLYPGLNADLANQPYFVVRRGGA